MTVNDLKIELYDLIERQSILAAQNQQLEQMKVDKLKELQEAREAEKPTKKIVNDDE